MGKTARPRPDDVMGRTLKNAKRAQRQHVRDLLSSSNPNGTHSTDDTKLHSVWEATDLQDFLHAAEQNQKDFTAERNVRMVVQGVTHVYHDDKLKPLQDAADSEKWFELSKQLPIPLRPAWNHRMSKSHIEAQERDAFLAWRRQLASIEEKEGVTMTPYERNLEVWRQLWRVIERSDLVANILDARNPLAFRSKATEEAVKAAKKQLVLLLNKAELLTEKQRLAWAKYFQNEGVLAIFFSAQAAKEKQDSDEGVEAGRGREGDGREADAGGNDQLALDQLILKQEEEAELDRAMEELDEANAPAKPAAASAAAPKPAAKKARRNNRKLKGAPAMHIADAMKQHSFPDPKKAKRDADAAAAAAAAAPTDPEVERTERLRKVEKLGGLAAALEYHKQNPERIYSPADLIDFFLLHRKDDGVSLEGRPVMAGFIGYPNVGKSSTINVLWKSKKVNVSATPGKTKHFQTLILPDERRVMLCDCPGLVFPSFASTRDHMIVDGILPISQLKDALTPMRIVESRIRKEIFEMAYTINLDWQEDKDNSPTSFHLLCNQFARARGLMTDHDKPNMSRAARHILTDYVAGKLVWVCPPPGLKAADIETPIADLARQMAVDDEEEEEIEEIEEIEEVEELEEEEEEEGPGAVNWDHVLPGRKEEVKEPTAAEKFNMENANEDAIFSKLLQPKTKKAHRAKQDTGGDHLVNEAGMHVVEVSDDDCIEEIVGPEIPIDPKTQQPARRMTKRQMRMHQKNEMRGRVGTHHNKGIAGVSGTADYATIFPEQRGK